MKATIEKKTMITAARFPLSGDESATINFTRSGSDLELPRRMVACWNACEGIEIEALEGHALQVIAAQRSQIVHDLIAARDALRPQADALHKIAHAVGLLPGEEVTGAVEKVSAVISALKLYEKAFDEMFIQCCSNGMYDAWGRMVSCATLNEANYYAQKALRNGPATAATQSSMPIEPPAEVIKAATIIGDYVRRNNIKNWRIGDCCSENYYSELEREHLGDPDKRTGIYAEPTATESKGGEA